MTQHEKGRVVRFCGARRPFEFEEYPVPEPLGEQLVIRIERASICGSDLHFWRGEDPAVEAVANDRGLAFGHETAGRVALLGPQARGDL